MKKYLCGIAWRHELGNTNMDGYIHDSVEDLKANHTCWVECGIVEVECPDDREPGTTDPHTWIVPEDLDWRKFQKINSDLEANKESDQ